jgi:3-oxoacyl-[acyl-carrier protein] reductase
MSDSSFAGRTALVTGSAAGLGKTLSIQLAQRGANVIINARSSQDLVDKTVAEIRDFGGVALGVLADVSKEKDVESLSDQALEAFGRVDILVNNAGIRPTGRVLELELDQWHEVLGVKLDGAFMTCRAFLPGMIEQEYGRIVNISGIDAFWGNERKLHVGVANYGLIGLTRGLAVQYASTGITVNAVVPGSFDTHRRHADDWYADHRFDRLISHIPAARQGQPEELAAVCRFLVSDEASYVTGQTVHVNGGIYPTQGDHL